MNNVSKKIHYFFLGTIFTVILSIGCHVCLAHIDFLESEKKAYGSSSDYGNLWLNYDSEINSIRYTDNHNNYGIRNGGDQTNTYYQNGFKVGNCNPGKGTILSGKKDDYFQEAYCNPAIENEILNCHACYKSEQFLAYARTLPHYNQHIFDIQKRIKDKEEFIVDGFDRKFTLWWKKNDFHNFIANEAQRIQDEITEANRIRNEKIRKQQDVPRLNLTNTRDIDLFGQYCKQLNENDFRAEDNADISRLNARINAINQTRKDAGKCYDYSSQVKHIKFNDPCADAFNNCYGTALDKQLHEELCQARIEILDLQKNNADNIHVRAFCPIILLSTAQAKIEKDAIKAFTISDFAHDLVRIASGGINLLKNGVLRTEKALGRALNTSLDWKHWKDMGLGIINLLARISEEQDRQERDDNTFAYGLITGNYEPYFKQSKEYEQYYRAVGQALQHEILSELAKIKKMSWGELYENGLCAGVVLAFDGVIINFASTIATSAGRNFIRQIADTMNAPGAEAFALEAAGIGKITLEEGSEVADRIFNFVVNNPELVADYNASQNLTWGSGNIPSGAIYKELVGIAPEVMPAQNLKHYFLGEIESEKGKLILKGFHHAKSYPDRIKEIIIPRDLNGCYKARYVYNGLEKKSTFFPDHWNRITVMKKISEAYKNPISFSERGLLGKTSEGIKIQMWFLKNAKTGEKLIINSAYPIIE